MPTMPTQIGPLIPSLKVLHLFDQIAHDPVDLLDHRLGKDLDLGSDFNGGYGTTRHFEACVSNAFYARDDSPKVPSPRRDATPWRRFCALITRLPA